MGSDKIDYPPEAGGSASGSVYGGSSKKKKKQHSTSSAADHSGYDVSGAYPPQAGAEDDSEGPPE